MKRKQIVNLLEVPENILICLWNETNASGFKFIEKSIVHHGHGYFIDLVIFKHNEKYFKFLAIEYLDDCITFTVPYEVIKTEREVTHTSYTNWIDVE